jgi:hypothetical protein
MKLVRDDYAWRSKFDPFELPRPRRFLVCARQQRDLSRSIRSVVEAHVPPYTGAIDPTYEYTSHVDS